MPRRVVTFDTVREIALALPGVDEGVSYGTPALRVKGKLFVRLREDGETLVVRTTDVDRAYLMRTDPEVFFITDHYRDYPWVLVRLPRVRIPVLRELLEQAWRRTAPKRLISALDTLG